MKAVLILVLVVSLVVLAYGEGSGAVVPAGPVVPVIGKAETYKDWSSKKEVFEAKQEYGGKYFEIISF